MESSKFSLQHLRILQRNTFHAAFKTESKNKVEDAFKRRLKKNNEGQTLWSVMETPDGWSKATFEITNRASAHTLLDDYYSTNQEKIILLPDISTITEKSLIARDNDAKETWFDVEEAIFDKFFADMKEKINTARTFPTKKSAPRLFSSEEVKDEKILKKPKLDIQNSAEYEDDSFDKPVELIQLDKDEVLKNTLDQPLPIRSLGVDFTQMDYCENPVDKEIYLLLHTSNKNLWEVIAVDAVIGIFSGGIEIISVGLSNYFGQAQTYYLEGEKNACHPHKLMRYECFEEKPQLSNRFECENKIAQAKRLVGFNIDSILTKLNFVTRAKRSNYRLENIKPFIKNKLHQNFNSSRRNAQAAMVIERYTPVATFNTSDLRKIMEYEAQPKDADAIFTFILETKMFPFLTKFVAIDCEFHKQRPKEDYKRVKEVALINYYGHTLLHRRKIDEDDSAQGIMSDAIKDILNTQEEVKIVGQSTYVDLKSLSLKPTKYGLVIDIAKMITRYQRGSWISVSLKEECKYFLNADIQITSNHNPLEDARAAMAIFRLFPNNAQDIQIKIPFGLKYPFEPLNKKYYIEPVSYQKYDI